MAARGKKPAYLCAPGDDAVPAAPGLGKVVLLDRGTNSFYEKVRNVQLSGGVGRDTSYGFGLVQAKAALDALAALNPGPGSADTTAPLITNVVGTVTNAKNGSFQITWQTNEPATSDVQISGTMYPDATLTTNHKRTFRGSKGATYTYNVISADAAGNSASSGPHSITIK